MVRGGPGPRVMNASWRCATLIALAWLGFQKTYADSNIAFPIRWLEEQLSAGKWLVCHVKGARFENDIAQRGMLITESGETFPVKLRAAKHRDTFNNVPRYELAAYRLQRLFLEPNEYVVPTTVFRGVPLNEVHAWGRSRLEPTYKESDQVFFVVQYWLANVESLAEPLDKQRFEKDPNYARHIANLNVLTYLIAHKDANRGNILLSTDLDRPRAFTVDNGVSFRSEESEQGAFWRRIRVPALPSKTINRLKAIELDTLRAELLVVSQHRLENGRYVPTAATQPLDTARGVTRNGGLLQLGLTEVEIRQVLRRVHRLTRRVERSELKLF